MTGQVGQLMQSRGVIALLGRLGLATLEHVRNWQMDIVRQSVIECPVSAIVLDPGTGCFNKGICLLNPFKQGRGWLCDSFGRLLGFKL